MCRFSSTRDLKSFARRCFRRMREKKSRGPEDNGPGEKADTGIKVCELDRAPLDSRGVCDSGNAMVEEK